MVESDRIAKLEAALAWALEHGARYYSTPGKPDDGNWYGDCCGCCEERLEPPAEIIDVLKESV